MRGEDELSHVQAVRTLQIAKFGQRTGSGFMP